MINNTIAAQTDLALSKTYNHISGFYFIAAHTLQGTRFYSKPIATFVEAEKLFSQYVDIIDYFKGGVVEMYQIYDDDFDIISCVHV